MDKMEIFLLNYHINIKITYGSEKYVIVPLLHNENELFEMICQIFVIRILNITFNTIKIFL